MTTQILFAISHRNTHDAATVVQERSHIPWDDLDAIRAVAAAGSIRQAAEAMGIAHTTLARRIDAAEARLGTRAFLRSTRGFALTPAGELIVAHANRMADEAAALRRRLSGGDGAAEGLVRVAMPPGVLTACIARALPRFRDSAPGIRLDLDLRLSYSDLDRNEADVAVRYQDRPSGHLVGQRVGQSRERAYATAEVAARHAAGQAVPLIAWSDSPGFRSRAQALGLGHLPVGYVCTDVHAQVVMAEAGLGIAILPTIAASDSARLQPVGAAAALIGQPIWVLTHPDLARATRVRLVSGFLADTLRQALAQPLP